ncbi:MAG: hypothetical protein AB8B58_08525 [Roseobacter sp.]
MAKTKREPLIAPKVQHPQTQSRKIAQNGADTASHKRRTLAVDRLVSVLLDTHPAPPPIEGMFGDGFRAQLCFTDQRCRTNDEQNFQVLIL